MAGEQGENAMQYGRRRTSGAEKNERKIKIRWDSCVSHQPVSVLYFPFSEATPSRRGRKVRWFLVLFMGLAWVPPLLAGEVGDCQDGSTCQVTDDAYTGPVKLFCVEAPAVTDPIGKKAKEALNAEIRGTIRLLMDSQDQGVPIAEFIRDDDGHNLGLELIRAGLARVNTQYCAEIPYLLAEHEAKQAKAGIWASP